MSQRIIDHNDKMYQKAIDTLLKQKQSNKIKKNPNEIESISIDVKEIKREEGKK